MVIFHGKMLVHQRIPTLYLCWVPHMAFQAGLAPLLPHEKTGVALMTVDDAPKVVKHISYI